MGEYDRGNLFVFAVTPCVGVWIEMESPKAFCSSIFVTPSVGVWIEMVKMVF